MPDSAFTTLYHLNQAKTNIIAVVPPPENHPAYYAFSQYAKNLGYQIIAAKSSINEPQFIEKIKNLNADLAVVTSYSEKFSKEFLETTKDGFLNAHPSLLPEYRGANPYSHVIINGETETGITLHKMDENFDTGEIYLQKVVPIAQNDTMGTLFNRLNILTGEMLVEFLNYYEKQGLPQGKVQTEFNKNPKHKAPKIPPDSGKTVIKWNKSAQEIERFIRGLNPFLPAGTRFKGYYVKIFTAEAINIKSKYQSGTICSLGNTIDVATGNGVIKIRSLQFGNHFIGDAKDLLERVKIQIGDKFELMN